MNFFRLMFELMNPETPKTRRLRQELQDAIQNMGKYDTTNWEMK